MSSGLIPFLECSSDVGSLGIYSALCLDAWSAQGSTAVFTKYLLAQALISLASPPSRDSVPPRPPPAGILNSFADTRFTFHIIHRLKYTMQWLQCVQGAI